MFKSLTIRILVGAVALAVVALGSVALFRSGGSEAARSTSTPTYQSPPPVDRLGDAQPDF